jgi:hypothetical protein
MIVTIVIMVINNAGTKGEVIAVSADATWAPIDGGDSEEAVVNNSTFIGRGKLLGADTEIRGDVGNEMVFTINHMLITQIYAINENEISTISDDMNSNSLIVDVLQTGGKYGKYITPALGDAPLLQKGTEYFLFLENTEEGYYLPIGGRLGIAEIINGRIEFVNDEAADLLSSFEGDKVTKIIADLLSIANEIDNAIEINENNESITEVLAE